MFQELSIFSIIILCKNKKQKNKKKKKILGHMQQYFNPWDVQYISLLADFIFYFFLIFIYIYIYFYIF